MGVSIPSQLRWVNYVDRWTNKMNKKYVERPVEIVEVHVWGLRDGVKVAVEGYIDNGRKIRTFHTFTREEKIVMEDSNRLEQAVPLSKKDEEVLTSPVEATPQSSSANLTSSSVPRQTIILSPSARLILPTSDINIDFERRNKAGYTGFTMVTAIAHVWFNAYFEGGHEGHDSGVFEIEWEAMDGIKGSARKGTKALDRLKVVWKYAKPEAEGTPAGKIVTEPGKGEPIPEEQPADWRGEEDTESRPADGVGSGRKGGAALTMGAMINQGASTLGKELGLRSSHPESANLSCASSIKEGASPAEESQSVRTAGEDSDDEGVQPFVPDEEGNQSHADAPGPGQEGRQDTKAGKMLEAGMAKVAHTVSKMKST